MIDWENKKHRLTVWLVIAQILDVILTAIGVWLLGATEANPLANTIPLWLFMLIKMSIVALMAWYLLKAKSYLWVYRVLCGISSGVVVWNSIILGLIVLE